MDYLRGVWERAFVPPDTREIWEYIEQEGELPSAYAAPGPFDITTCPMLKAPLRALRNALVRHVVVMSGVQCLKTLLGEFWLIWLVANDPGPTQWLQNTNDEAKEHYKERFGDLIKAYPDVHRFFGDSRHDTTSTFIKFRHGMYIRMEGVETPANLQRKSIKNQMRSEVWQSKYWRPGKLKEADSRLTQFVHNSKQYTESQPGWDDEFKVDDMHAAYLEGDQNRWEFQCEYCKRPQPYMFSYFRSDGTRAGIRFDLTERTTRKTNSSDPNEKYRWNELKQTIRIECMYAGCGHRHYDEPLTRRRMLASSDHLPQNPDADPAVQSFNWNQWGMPNLSWYRTKIGGVYNFMLAHAAAKMGNEKPLREFYQKVDGVPYHPAKHGVFHSVESIQLECRPDENKAIELQGIRFVHRFMGVDVQQDHFWVLIEIWSTAGDSLTLWFEKVTSWNELRARQEQFWVPDQNVAVDISHRRPEVIEWCTRHGHWETAPDGPAKGKRFWLCWNALQGSDQDTFRWVPRGGADKGKKIELPYSWPPEWGDPCAGLGAKDGRRVEFKAGMRCKIFSWSNPWIKDVVVARQRGRAEKVRSLVSRGAWNAEFSVHMHSQRKMFVKPELGRGRWKWGAIGGRPEHGHDCKCQIQVLAWQKNLGQVASATGPGGLPQAGAEEGEPEA